jgi:hypothetical protein
MIGTQGATILAVASLSAISILGMFAGGLTCKLLQRRWGWSGAVRDLIVAAFVTTCGALLITKIHALHQFAFSTLLGLVITVTLAFNVVRAQMSSDRRA